MEFNQISLSDFKDALINCAIYGITNDVDGIINNYQNKIKIVDDEISWHHNQLLKESIVSGLYEYLTPLLNIIFIGDNVRKNFEKVCYDFEFYDILKEIPNYSDIGFLMGLLNTLRIPNYFFTNHSLQDIINDLKKLLPKKLKLIEIYRRSFMNNDVDTAEQMIKYGVEKENIYLL